MRWEGCQSTEKPRFEVWVEVHSIPRVVAATIQWWTGVGETFLLIRNLWRLSKTKIILSGIPEKNQWQHGAPSSRQRYNRLCRKRAADMKQSHISNLFNFVRLSDITSSSFSSKMLRRLSGTNSPNPRINASTWSLTEFTNRCWAKASRYRYLLTLSTAIRVPPGINSTV